MKYVGVVGINGYGVYTDAKQLLRAKPYIWEYQARFFTDVNRAIKWAYNKYSQLQKIEQHQYQIDEITQLDWFYHRRY